MKRTILAVALGTILGIGSAFAADEPSSKLPPELQYRPNQQEQGQQTDQPWVRLIGAKNNEDGTEFAFEVKLMGIDFEKGIVMVNTRMTNTPLFEGLMLFNCANGGVALVGQTTLDEKGNMVSRSLVTPPQMYQVTEENKGQILSLAHASLCKSAGEALEQMIKQHKQEQEKKDNTI